MKTVEMASDHDYHPHRRMIVSFKAGITYRRVLEAAARDIERAGAGRIILDGSREGAAGSKTVDAWDAWQRRW